MWRALSHNGMGLFGGTPSDKKPSDGTHQCRRHPRNGVGRWSAQTVRKDGPRVRADWAARADGPNRDFSYDEFCTCTQSEVPAILDFKISPMRTCRGHGKAYNRSSGQQALVNPNGLQQFDRACYSSALKKTEALDHPRASLAAADVHSKMTYHF